MTYKIHRNVFLLLFLLETVGEHGLELIVLFLIVSVCIAALYGLVSLHLLMDGGGPKVDRIAVGSRALDRGRCWGSGVPLCPERVFGECDGLFLALFQRRVKQRFFRCHVDFVAVAVDEDAALLVVDIESLSISGVDAENLSRRTNFGRDVAPPMFPECSTIYLDTFPCLPGSPSLVLPLSRLTVKVLPPKMPATWPPSAKSSCGSSRSETLRKSQK